MTLGSALLSELRADRTASLAVGLVLTVLLSRLTVGPRRNLRPAFLFLGLHLLGAAVTSALKAIESSFYLDARLLTLLFAAMLAVELVTVVLFTVLLPRVHVRVSRITQDVVFGGALIVSVLSIATRIGFNLSGVIATSAVVTAVIGFSLQDTLGNVMGGLALQLDNSIQVGDWIRVGELTGKVTEIRWRYTAIETRNWETAVIPNSMLMKGQVMVLGRRIGQPVQWRRWVYFNIDFRRSPADVIHTVTDALRTVPIPNVAADPCPNCILIDLHESYARYAVRYWLTDLSVDDPTDSVVRTRIYFALHRANIPLSIPAQAVFVTQDSDVRHTAKDERSLKAGVLALAQVDLFSHLADDERAELAHSLISAPFAEGEIITRQSAVAHWLYLLTSGTVGIRVRGETGLEREVSRLEAPNFFGEMGLLTGAPRVATVVALTEVQCHRLDKNAFAEVIRRRPQMAEQLAKVLSERRVGLLDAQQHLDEDERNRRMAEGKVDILERIEEFFGLKEVKPLAGKQ